MMNREKTSKIAVLKYALIIPALFCLTLTNSAQKKQTVYTEVNEQEHPHFKATMKKAFDTTAFSGEKNRDATITYGRKITRKGSSRDIKISGDTTSLASKLKALDNSFDLSAPLYILDGFESSYEKINKIDYSKIKSITILKDKTAVAIYGKKAENGAVIVETKIIENNKNEVVVTGYYNGSKDKMVKSGEEVVVKGYYKGNVKDTNEVIVTGFYQGEKRDSNQKIVRGYYKDNDVERHDLKKDIGSNALYILNGLEITKDKYDKINVGEIESITILKENTAKKIYGVRGENGVVVIETKKNNK